MPHGYMGKILSVDLSTGAIEEREVAAEQYSRSLSGMGLAVETLFREIPAGADPMGPDNVLGLVSGLLTGTGAQMVGRFMAAGKSPLTGGWGDANGGGHFSPAIKRAGYDGIFFKGAADRPVYLFCGDGRAELRDAAGLMGLDTVATEEQLRAETGIKDLKVACIGPAGERRSLLAGIVTEGARIAARSGLGGVMGAKNLKAVALAGKAKIECHDPKTIAALSKDFSAWMKQGDKTASRLPGWLNRVLARFMRVSPMGFAATSDMTRMFLRAYGTIITNVLSSEMGDSPVKNWKGAGATDFPLSTHSGALDPVKIVAHQRERYHCYSCPLGCGGIMDLAGKTRFDLGETHKPEYETCASFGSLILNNDLDAVFYLNDLLNRAGMDTIGAGSAVAFAMECFEQGLLSADECDGIEPRWGDATATIALVEKMVRREGIGDLLADGAKKAAERLGRGSEKLAMHAGGQDLPMHDPRLDPGFAVAYSMEPTPARHTNYSYLYLELFGLDKIFPGLPPVEAFYRKSSRAAHPGGKDDLLAAASRYLQVANGAGSCIFGLECGPRYPLLAYLNAATGWDRSPTEWLDTGERIQHLRQAFNVKHGVTPGRHFKLPPRVEGDPPLASGPLKGVRLPVDELNRGFARKMFWDNDGRPDPNRMRELGLTEAADELDLTSTFKGQ